jgi:hypothetical protein
MDFVIVANTGTIAYRYEGEDDTVITYLHIVFDIHEGEYLTVVANLSLWTNLSLGGYFACHNYQFSIINLLTATTKRSVEAYHRLHLVEVGRNLVQLG